MNMLTDTDARLDAPTVGWASRFADWPLALRSILGFWAVYALTVVARALLSSDPLTILQNKVLTLGVGILLTGLIYLLLKLLPAHASLRRRALAAGGGSLLAACLMASMLVLAENQMRQSKEEFRYQAREGFVVIAKGEQIRIERSAAEPLVLTMPKVRELHEWEQFRIAADAAVVWLFFFAAWTAFYLAAVSQAQTLTMERRAAAAESAAQEAQVRALRYQVNPHFLFNTLNSLSSLVMSGRPEEAESMILKLSTFFRTSLSLDPNADVTLAEEIELQRLYLDIEKVRFPRRLKVEIDVPPDLAGARLPALILQPVVENAIKYGISVTREKVILRISAREEAGKLEIAVSNSGSLDAKAPRKHSRPDGTKVGLVNVCQRLDARFGRAASCTFGPIAEGGFRVVITLPVTRANG